ncbi:hypothetical protein BDV98DRAFT_561768 [Pterulicium gracile]|uniref:Uncharacterized protein n=1 Tax=Pterulicium gracile TaxID=1884261 RepID=A0A5C3QTC5_9AGAR|nr:hypothetical protein BDV98DRAFT_561768 [Pterula gracilis]
MTVRCAWMAIMKALEALLVICITEAGLVAALGLMLSPISILRKVHLVVLRPNWLRKSINSLNWDLDVSTWFFYSNFSALTTSFSLARYNDNDVTSLKDLCEAQPLSFNSTQHGSIAWCNDPSAFEPS